MYISQKKDTDIFIYYFFPKKICTSLLDNAPIVGCVIQKRWADLLENALTAKKFLFYNSFSGNNLLSVIFLYIIWLLFTEQDFNLKTNVFLEKQQYFPFDKIFPRFKSNNVIYLYDITIQKQK